MHVYTLQASAETDQYVMRLSSSLYSQIQEYVLGSSLFGVFILLVALAAMTGVKRAMSQLIRMSLDFKHNDLVSSLQTCTHVLESFTTLCFEERFSFNNIRQVIGTCDHADLF